MTSFLIVAPFCLFPATQGDRIAGLEYARALSRFGPVRVLTVNSELQPLENAEPQTIAAVMRVPPPRPSALLRAWRVIGRRRQNGFLWYRLDDLVETIQRLVTAHGITHVHFETSMLVELALRVRACLPMARVSLRSQNIDSLTLAALDPENRRWAGKAALLRWLAPVVGRSSFRAEMRLLKKLGKVGSLSFGDNRVMLENGVPSVLIGPPIPDFPHVPVTERATAEFRILFAGAIVPSTTGGGLAEALEALLGDDPLPVRVDLVGHGPDPALLQWQEDPRVRFHGGGFASVDHFWRDTDVMLAAVRVVRGVRIKVIEALARGVPVIATPEALYGFDPAIRQVVECYDTGSELRAIVSRLSGDRAALRRMSDEGRRYYCDHFTASACESALRDFHEV
jgi:glycosyltransferase involved in cell wall biosynthesis